MDQDARYKKNSIKLINMSKQNVLVNVEPTKLNNTATKVTKNVSPKHA